MSGNLKRVNPKDILNIDKTIDAYNKRVDKGDDSVLETNMDTIKKENKKTKSTVSTGRNSKYSGPLSIYLDEFEISHYSQDILQFRDFFDGLGDTGVTYEYLFEKIEEYNTQTGNKDITVSKIKSKLYQMNALNTISLATIRDIARMLGYEMEFKFDPVITEEIFDNQINLKDM